MPASNARNDKRAVANALWKVQIGASEGGTLSVAYFHDCSGLSIEMQAEEYAEGGGVVHKFPGRVRYSNIILKRGMTTDTDLYKWYMEVLNGNFKRRNVGIQLLDSEGNVVQEWSFLHAFPVKWVGPDLTANTGTLAVETLELAHEGIIDVK
ncbi:MAG: phage tail protein [bacterium]